MINDIKIGISLMKYGYAYKSSLFFMVAQVVIGLFMGLVIHDNSWMHIYILISASIWPIQLLQSCAFSKYIQSTPFQKKLDTSIATSINVLSSLVLYVLLLIMKGIQVAIGYNNARSLSTELLICSCFFFAMLLYSALAYKLFVFSTLQFFVLIILITLFANYISYHGLPFVLPLWAAILSGFIAIIIGGAAGYLVTCLCHRLPISKHSQLTGLRKHL